MNNQTGKKGNIVYIAREAIIFLFAGASIWADYRYFHRAKTFTSLTNAFFSAVVAIASIWAALYLLFFQLYKDRYPLQLAQKYNTKSIKEIFSDIIFSIAFGASLIALGYGFIAPLAFSLFAFCCIIRIFIEVYKTQKTFMVSSYVDDYCEDIKHKFRLKELPGDSAIKEVYSFYEESVIKEEYSVAQCITDNMGTIFREFMEDSIKLVSDGEKEEDVNKTFHDIVKFNISQLQSCENINSDVLVSHAINQNFKNIKFCIKAGQYEWFKQYIEALNNLMYILQEDNQSKTADRLVSLYCAVLKHLIQDDKEEWIKYYINEYLTQTRDLNFITGNVNLRYAAQFISSGLLECLNKKKSNIYTYLFESFTELTDIINRVPNAFSDTKVFYAILFNRLLKEKDNKLEKFANLVFDKDYSMSEDTYWTEFKFYCLCEIEEISLSEDFSKAYNEYHIQTILAVIDQKSYQGFVYLPEFSKGKRQTGIKNGPADSEP